MIGIQVLIRKSVDLEHIIHISQKHFQHEYLIYKKNLTLEMEIQINERKYAFLPTEF